MKTSEVIQNLQRLIDEYGDLEFAYESDGMLHLYKKYRPETHFYFIIFNEHKSADEKKMIGISNVPWGG